MILVVFESTEHLTPNCQRDEQGCSVAVLSLPKLGSRPASVRYAWEYLC